MTKLVIGIPSGKLESEIVQTLQMGGINICDSPTSTRRYTCEPKNHPLVSSIIYIKPCDIPDAIFNGYIDAGFISSEKYDEWQLTSRKRLYFSNSEKSLSEEEPRRSYLALVGPRGSAGAGLPTPRRMVDTIVTDYPNYSQLIYPKATILAVNGAVEGYVRTVVPYGITLVETGNTLKANNLEVLKILRNNWTHLYFGESFLVDEVGSCQEPISSLVNLWLEAKQAYQTQLKEKLRIKDVGNWRDNAGMRH